MTFILLMKRADWAFGSNSVSDPGKTLPVFLAGGKRNPMGAFPVTRE